MAVILVDVGALGPVGPHPWLAQLTIQPNGPANP
jgi:hypothetical protein